MELNLKVVTDYLQELGRSQQQAADQITGANRFVADCASKVESTHGLVCWATTRALANDADRNAAGQTLARVSTELRDKLAIAATNYNNIDYREGRSLGEAGAACEV
ncbi:ESX-1 secretion-associated protein [Mycolicibacterium wolinskyi]|uniref:ESX-1 secretion-associated protein n=1 Tax=Mycolicibacterium wolinskyi TaxID=59750 RepID=UPI002285E9DE|nr:ESX-1 secretion-associated protein [Mycolicibacterium wolinskyi]